LSHLLNLETARLRLVIPDDSLAGAVADYMRRNRDHFAASSPAMPEAHYSEEHWKKGLSQIRSDFESGRSARVFLLLKAGEEEPIVGNVSLIEIMRGTFQACILGYRLDERSQGRGYMLEALEQAIRFAFDELALHRIMANYRPENERSGKLLKKLGFQTEGFARDYLFLEGAWRDHVLTALVNPRPPAPVR
jgi:ribosomal-protein-alanine N-acetyltransferase